MTAAAPSITRLASPDVKSDLDLETSELKSVLELAADVKREPEAYRAALAGKSIALLFEKPSLRTRMTFELAIQQLGGFALLGEGPIGLREPLKDIARNLDRWVSGIVARTFHQTTIEELARWANVPVINALSDRYHPCQALADMQTIRERFGSYRGVKLTFVGDGNNVANSLALSAAGLGMNFTIATPPGYEMKPDILEGVRRIAARSGSKIQTTHDAAEAVRGAQAVYTDVWASMGAENEAAERRTAFASYQVNSSVVCPGRNGRYFHALPAGQTRRGSERCGD